MLETASLERYRQTIYDHHRLTEQQAMMLCLPLVAASGDSVLRQQQLAADWIDICRRQHRPPVFDRLIQSFDLSSNEGRALMCMAEAIMRIPDRSTANRLIADQLLSCDWQLNSSTVPWSARLFLWGMSCCRSIVNETEAPNRFGKALRKLLYPFVLSSVRRGVTTLSRHFIFAASLTDAQRPAGKLSDNQCLSVDCLGESARTCAMADSYFQAYAQAIKQVSSWDQHPRHAVSIKLSALHPRFGPFHSERLQRELLPRLLELLQSAKSLGVPITLDAETSDTLDVVLDIVEAVANSGLLDDWPDFGLAVQAYQKRSLAVIDWLAALARGHAIRLNVRLVKGAYWDTEIKLSQQRGDEEYPVYTQKSHTDIAYLACAAKLRQANDVLFAQYATHNPMTAAVLVDAHHHPEEYREAGLSSPHSSVTVARPEFQCLYGMGQGLHDQLQQDYTVRVYAPIGAQKELLPYLVRRLLENGANTSFLHQLHGTDCSKEQLTRHPLTQWAEKFEGLKKPKDLFAPTRQNSHGFDLVNRNHCRQLLSELQDYQGSPLLSVHTEVEVKAVASLNPANHQEVIGYYLASTYAEIANKIVLLKSAQPRWRKEPLAVRASYLNRLADVIEQERNKLLILLVKEAGKSIPTAAAEIRETIDFCRYYSVQAQSLETYYNPDNSGPLGIVLCISPWNFPLAIFAGQILAALVMGNSVLAKPAEQTSMIAMMFMGLMLEAGIPNDVVQLLLGEGEVVVDQLFSLSDVDAVAFTGSIDAATSIQKRVLQSHKHDAPMIAETGGQNVMIVDSSAHLEQVVDSLIESSFVAAGQRCSAVRVLYVQCEVADALIQLLAGAMAELQIGDPTDLATDIGPVIDRAAQQRLQQHHDWLQQHGRCLYECELPTDLQHGYFVAPCLYEINDIAQLTEEVFGPVVHLIRYQQHEFTSVIGAVNQSGYGLTQGLHTRLQQRMDYAVLNSFVGNVYINRDTVGAVVGSQPFGGCGYSGTGPKAGGPLYLTHFYHTDGHRDDDIPSASVDLSKYKHRYDDYLSALQRSYEPFSWSGVSKTITTRTQAGVDQTNIERRCHVVEQFLGELSQQAWLESDDLLYVKTTVTGFIETMDGMRRQQYCPGPAGESNQWLLYPRGTVLCLHAETASLKQWLLQVCAALLGHNSVLATCGFHYSGLYRDIVELWYQCGIHPSELQFMPLVNTVQLEPLYYSRRIDAIAMNSSREFTLFIRQRLLKRPGPPIPVIDDSFDPLYVMRFMQEKSVCINTAAIGGSVELLYT